LKVQMGRRCEIAQGKAIDLPSECMYTVTRCVDPCGKPLAMGATTKLEYLRRPSGYKDFGKVRIGLGRVIHRPLQMVLGVVVHMGCQ